MTEKINDNIYRIIVPLPNNPLKSLNSYLIKTPSRNLLIDTGFRHPDCLKALKDGINEIGVNMKETDIFITHLHSDHSGLILDIADKDSKVYMNKIDKALLLEALLNKNKYFDATKGLYLKEGYPQDVWELSVEFNPAIIYAAAKAFESIDISDGDKITVGELEFTCVFTPGHTPGHTCLYLENEKILFSGDHILFDITPNITNWIGTDNSLGDYLDSLDKISKYDINMTLSSHRENKPNTYERIQQLKSHHKERLSELYDIIENDPGINGYNATSKMTWSIRAKDWDDFPPTQKWFAVGEAMSHLTYLEKAGRISKELIDNIYHYHVVK